MAGEFAEGPLILFFVRLEKTFEDEFRVRGYLQRDRFAINDLERFAANRAGHRQLVDSEWKRTRSRHYQARIDADRNGDRKRFGRRFTVLEHKIRVRSRENSERAKPVHLIAINTDIASA